MIRLLRRTILPLPFWGRGGGGGGSIAKMFTKLFSRCIVDVKFPAAGRMHRHSSSTKKKTQPLTSNVQSVFTNPTSKNAKHLGTTLTKRASRLQSRIFYYWHDHIQVVNQLLEKVKEYKIPLYFASVNHKKAFDSTEFTAVFKALENQGVDQAYITILPDLYNGATSVPNLHRDSDKIKLEKGFQDMVTINFSQHVSKML